MVTHPGILLTEIPKSRKTDKAESAGEEEDMVDEASVMVSEEMYHDGEDDESEGLAAEDRYHDDVGGADANTMVEEAYRDGDNEDGAENDDEEENV